MHPVSVSAAVYEFTPREFERLAVYRAAVRAGYYSDYLDCADEWDCPVLVVPEPAPEPAVCSWCVVDCSVRHPSGTTCGVCGCVC